MPLPVVPLGILWIIVPALALGVLGTVIVWLLTDEGVMAMLSISMMFLFFLLIPFLPDRYQWVRDLKNKLRFFLQVDKDNENQ